MCGINGFYNYSKVTISEGYPLLNKMNELINHRGPDDSGVWSDSQQIVFLGHQRLSILDLSTKGHQPMVSEKGSVIVYNGEIYNFQNLRKRLVDRLFFSRTDTEVLLYLYEKYGHKCLDLLNGMFAFAIWDDSKKELFLARDRVGIKPIYYTTNNGIFVFSSEIKSILTLPWMKAEFDKSSLYDFLTFSRLSPPNTMFKNIYKFHPGYYMIVGEYGIKTYKPYWEISYLNLDSFGEKDLADLIFFELENSVKKRLVSDVPVGVFLSGGVDSSSIVATASKFSSKPIKTFSIGFENSPEYDERLYASEISKYFSTEHSEKVVTPRDLVDFLPNVVEIFDEPLADETSIPIYFLSSMAREHGIPVILTGDGADEIFLGYRNLLRYVRLNPYYNSLSRLPRILPYSIAKLSKLFNINSSIYEMLIRMSKRQDFFWGGARGFKESIKRSFLSEKFLREIENNCSYNQILNFRQQFDLVNRTNKKLTYIDWLCYYGIKSPVPNRYLLRADRLGMANSVELRVPFLDHHFVNVALSVPSEWKIKNGEPKYILKKSLEQILPKKILYRKKQGFCVPLQKWACDAIVEYIDKSLKQFCFETEFFNEEAVRGEISRIRNGKVDKVSSLWIIFFLMGWFKKWIF